MQTFLTSYDLKQNAESLDSKRLFKQLLEGYQILDVLVNKKETWSNHPAIKQWKGYEVCLFEYIEAIWNECLLRNIAVNSQLFSKAQSLVSLSSCKLNYPIWWGREDIIKSHQSRLLCKGLIDEVCRIIKKEFHIKSIDAWLKINYNKTKNQLRYSDCKDLIKEYGIDEDRIQNYYQLNNPHWESDYTKEYIWPI